MDKVDEKTRSRIMSRVKSKETSLEIKFRKELWNRGFRYRKNSAKHFGKPDLVFSLKKAVVFVDSCFWHGCPKHLRQPKSNKRYWNEKIERNKKRDLIVNKHYKEMGWKIIRIWEHDINNKKKLNRQIDKVIKQIS